jgi:plastocyanin
MYFISSLAVAVLSASAIACSGGSEDDSLSPNVAPPTAAPRVTAAPTTLASAQASATPAAATTAEAEASPEATGTTAAAEPTSPPAPTLPPAPTAPLVPAGVPAPITGYGFPYQLTVPAGSTVVWTNYDSVSHDVTASNDSWTSGLLGEGESYARTFSMPGKYGYICRVHPYMNAVLIVE